MRSFGQQPFLFVSAGVILALCLLHMEAAHGRPIEEPVYKDTEEIMNDWNNDDSYYEEEYDESPVPVVKNLPPILVALPAAPVPTAPTTTTRKPVYFPKTEIELGPLFEQVAKARRNQAVEGPVDLPVPYIVWTKDPTGQEDNVNYWKKFYNTMYKVD